MQLLCRMQIKNVAFLLDFYRLVNDSFGRLRGSVVTAGLDRDMDICFENRNRSPHVAQPPSCQFGLDFNVVLIEIKCPDPSHPSIHPSIHLAVCGYRFWDARWVRHKSIIIIFVCLRSVYSFPVHVCCVCPAVVSVVCGLLLFINLKFFQFSGDTITQEKFRRNAGIVSIVYYRGTKGYSSECIWDYGQTELWILGWDIRACPTTTTRSGYGQDPDKRWLQQTVCGRVKDNFIYVSLTSG